MRTFRHFIEDQGDNRPYPPDLKMTHLKPTVVVNRDGVGPSDKINQLKQSARRGDKFLQMNYENKTFSKFRLVSVQDEVRQDHGYVTLTLVSDEMSWKSFMDNYIGKYQKITIPVQDLNWDAQKKAWIQTGQFLR